MEHHDNTTPSDDIRHPSEEEQATTAGGGASGIVGMAAGAGVGLLLGPVGAVIGALAGGAGGWWAGKQTVAAISEFDNDEDMYRRMHDAESAQHSYDDVRHAYVLGHLAGRNPDYLDRDFRAVEPDLRDAWQRAHQHGETWDSLRPYVDRGFTHARRDSRARDIRDR
jgi:hypothetical protein